jgi:pyridinium-3,5-biscarboxylic acid mononucleotide synthase
MNRESLLELLGAVQSGMVSAETAAEQLSKLPYEDAGFAKIDHHRALRLGLPEVIYAKGKTPEQVAEIFFRMARMGSDVLATRADAAAFEAVRVLVPAAEYHEVAKAISLRQSVGKSRGGPIAVVCAGTSDLPVAEEAAVTAEVMGVAVERVYDVGVAGLHRLLAQRELLNRARAVIVCAGMEGALPSVVGGLVGAPVIAVPTSIGYGAAFGGVAALLGMLNSCSPNVSVVNIDNGFGAAYVAAMIVRTKERIEQDNGEPKTAGEQPPETASEVLPEKVPTPSCAG